MSTSNSSLQEPTCIPNEFTTEFKTVEEMFLWIASHKPLRRDIYIKSRILMITFCVGPTSCSIQTWYDGTKAGFWIEYCINNNKTFPQYEVHSMNVIGKVNIKSYIESFKSTIK